MKKFLLKTRNLFSLWKLMETNKRANQLLLFKFHRLKSLKVLSHMSAILIKLEASQNRPIRSQNKQQKRKIRTWKKSKRMKNMRLKMQMSLNNIMSPAIMETVIMRAAKIQMRILQKKISLKNSQRKKSRKNSNKTRVLRRLLKKMTNLKLTMIRSQKAKVMGPKTTKKPEINLKNQKKILIKRLKKIKSRKKIKLKKKIKSHKRMKRLSLKAKRLRSRRIIRKKIRMKRS